MSIDHVKETVDLNIKEFGWHLTYVFGEDGPPAKPGYVYSTGLTETLNHPEIMMMGFEPRLMQQLINGAAKLIKDNVHFSDKSEVTGVIDSYSVIFREVLLPQSAQWALICKNRYGSKGFRLLQMFLPDQKGLFPWQAGCSVQIAQIQSSLLASMPPWTLH